MKFLKWLLIVIAAVLALLFVIGLFLPREYRTEVSRVVPGSPQKVFLFLEKPANFAKFSPFHKMDTNMFLKYFGPDRGVGAGYEWKSDKMGVGNGTWTTKKVTPNSEIKVQMMFEEDPATITFALAPASGGTNVTWRIEGDYGWLPFMRVFGLVMDGMLKSQFTDGLNTLAKVLPNEPEPASVMIAPYPFHYALSMRGLVPEERMGQFFAQSYAAIMRYVSQNNLTVERHPFAIYHTFGNKLIDVQACIGVTTASPGNAEVKPVVIEPGNAAYYDHYGAYEASADSWAILRSEVTKMKKQAGMPLIEEYITDPMVVKDQSKWQTRLYVRVN